MKRPRPPRHPRAPRPPRKPRRAHKIKRATIQRWHKEDGTKASKRESLFADLMLPLLTRFALDMLGDVIGMDQQQGPYPVTPKGVPKDHRIGKEDPRDVVIDVKPEPPE